MFGISTLRFWRRCATAVAAALVAAAFAAPAAGAAVVHSTPVPTYQTNGRVNAILIQNGVIYLGGRFTAVRPAGSSSGGVTRNHAAALSLTTGQVLPWDPNVNGTVQALAARGGTIYLGGSFSNVGGASRTRLAAVDATSGAVIAGFNPRPDALVSSLAVSGSTVYLGGSFLNVGGTARSHLAAVDGATGALSTSWAPSADDIVKAVDVAVDGSSVYVAGSFTTIDGATHRHVAALDPTSGAALSSFSHGLPYAVVDMAVDANGVFIAGAGGGGNFAALNLTTGAMLWQGGTDGNVQAIATLDGIVYVGGHYDNYCGMQGGQHTCTTPITRHKLLAVDEATGALTSWNPSANSTLGVFALTGSGTTLAAGGDFTRIGGRAQQGFAEFTE
jgi:PQQ enzyme repeat